MQVVLRAAGSDRLRSGFQRQSVTELSQQAAATTAEIARLLYIATTRHFGHTVAYRCAPITFAHATTVPDEMHGRSQMP